MRGNKKRFSKKPCVVVVSLALSHESLGISPSLTPPLSTSSFSPVQSHSPSLCSFTHLPPCFSPSFCPKLHSNRACFNPFLPPSSSLLFVCPPFALGSPTSTTTLTMAARSCTVTNDFLNWDLKTKGTTTHSQSLSGTHTQYFIPVQLIKARLLH